MVFECVTGDGDAILTNTFEHVSGSVWIAIWSWGDRYWKQDSVHCPDYNKCVPLLCKTPIILSVTTRSWLIEKIKKAFEALPRGILKFAYARFRSPIEVLKMLKITSVSEWCFDYFNLYLNFMFFSMC